MCRAMFLVLLVAVATAQSGKYPDQNNESGTANANNFDFLR
jgi:hypothetical protein